MLRLVAQSCKINPAIQITKIITDGCITLCGGIEQFFLLFAFYIGCIYAILVDSNYFSTTTYL